MREVKFRGMSIDGEWVYGNLVQQDEKSYIVPAIQENILLGKTVPGCERVFPQSVGQKTGFKDKFGNDIYEGDLTAANYDDQNPDLTTLSVVQHKDGRFVVFEQHGDRWILAQDLDNFFAGENEIVGNVFDSPEYFMVCPNEPEEDCDDD